MCVCVCVPVEARVGIRYLETGATGSYELPDMGVPIVPSTWEDCHEFEASPELQIRPCKII